MFRFTIRDLLWLMVLVALALCWWRERAASLALRAQWDAEKYQFTARELELRRTSGDWQSAYEIMKYNQQQQKP